MDKPIRILNLFTIMNRGGAESMVMNYYRNTDKAKVQFDFMVHRAEEGAYDEEIKSLGGRIFKMPPIRPWTEMSYRKTVSEFYKAHPEYKIIHSHMSELGVYDFIEAERTGVPVRICHAHNRPYGFDLKTPVRFYYKKRMMPYLTHLFMCGEESGRYLFGKKYADRFIQMNNAIDVQKYSFDLTKRTQTREKLNIAENQVAVGHVGRFYEQKNHAFLLEIFKEVHRINENTVLLLIGDNSGSLAQEIHRKVKDFGIEKCVRFLGTRSDVPNLLQAMDVFLFPSLFEGLSVASIEAQAAGLPVLISDAVPIECKKTDLVEVIPLSEAPRVWAEKVLEAAKTQRRNTFEEIKNAGYDIKENAKRLEEFYLKAYAGAK